MLINIKKSPLYLLTIVGTFFDQHVLYDPSIQSAYNKLLYLKIKKAGDSLDRSDVDTFHVFLYP